MGEKLRELLERYVEAGTLPGAVVSVARDRRGRENTEVVVVGDMALGGPRMRPDAIMRISSMTKPVTAAATLRLVQEGRLELHDPVARWLPELKDRRVLTAPDAPLEDTVPAHRPIIVRDLLINGSGYGVVFGDSPLAAAMREAGLEAGPQPPCLGADEWLTRLAYLPLAHQPGEGFRYHHSFGLLGILLSRLDGRGLSEFLRETVFEPLDMPDTGLWVPPEKSARLPAAYRHEPQTGALVETEPARGGRYLGPPPHDMAHGELVSTASDFHRFVSMLAHEGFVGEGRGSVEAFLAPELIAEMTRDQVLTSAKTEESFFPEFWDGTGWGYGVAVQLWGEQRGRYGWAGGQGTDFFVDPFGGVSAILLTQVELGERMWPLLEQFQEVVW